MLKELCYDEIRVVASVLGSKHRADRLECANMLKQEDMSFCLMPTEELKELLTMIKEEELARILPKYNCWQTEDQD